MLEASFPFLDMWDWIVYGADGVVEGPLVLAESFVNTHSVLIGGVIEQAAAHGFTRVVEVFRG